MAQQTLPDTKQLRKDELKALATATGPCLSLFMSWHNSGNAREFQTRWKGMVRQAEQRLEEQGIDPKQSQELLEPLRSVLDSNDVLSEEGQGIVVFRSPDLLRVIRLPHEINEKVVVADHFHVRPILAIPESEQHFYILALSQKHVRLLRCTDHSSEEVPLPPDVPTNLDDFNAFRKPDHDLENRASAGPSQGMMRGIHQGTNNDRENRDQYLHNFYKAIDKGLTDIFRHETAPLVLAGVEYELPIYRDVCTYEHLATEGVHGAPDGLKGGEMHKRGLEVAQKEFQSAREKYLVQYDKFFGAGKASSDVKEVVKAAYDGRVSHLFVAEGGEVRGNFDETTRRVRTHGQPHLGDEDLLNAAVIQTILHSGVVFLMPHNQIPNHSHVAALLRY